MNAKIEIVKELSLLYELSLSIGGTLDLSKTSEDFLKVWMRQKNIDFGSIWIQNTHLGKENSTSFSLIYAQPSFLISNQENNLSKEFYEKIKKEKAVQIHAHEAEFQYFINEKNSKFGTIWIIEVPDLGYVEFLFHEKNPSQNSFGHKEVKKASKVLEKLSFALQSCLLHNRILEETEQKIRFQKEIAKLALVAEKNG